MIKNIVNSGYKIVYYVMHKLTASLCQFIHTYIFIVKSRVRTLAQQKLVTRLTVDFATEFALQSASRCLRMTSPVLKSRTTNLQILKYAELSPNYLLPIFLQYHRN